uniref:Uncharacterized protein n=1 Tax=Globodera rostochiensis TaxID=31243 RepID=A0A914I3A2_GLORO
MVVVVPISYLCLADLDGTGTDRKGQFESIAKRKNRGDSRSSRDLRGFSSFAPSINRPRGQTVREFHTAAVVAAANVRQNHHTTQHNTKLFINFPPSDCAH